MNLLWCYNISVLINHHQDFRDVIPWTFVHNKFTSLDYFVFPFFSILSDSFPLSNLSIYFPWIKYIYNIYLFIIIIHIYIRRYIYIYIYIYICNDLIWIGTKKYNVLISWNTVALGCTCASIHLFIDRMWHKLSF